MGTYRAKRDQKLALVLVGFLLSALAPSIVHAVNGLNLIGSGGISTGLAGADTAVATDFTAMNTNPAGMTQHNGTHAGAALTIILPNLHFSNSGSSQGGEDDPLLIPNLGYIHPLSGTGLTLGIGLFTVGGTASDFRNLRTTLATTDKTSTIIRHYKLTPSLAYKVNDRLSVGAALAVSFSDVALKVAPNTPTGFESKGTCDRANGVALPGSCAFAFGFTPKLGLMYKPHDMVTLGLAYTFKTVFDYDGDKFIRNQPGIGNVEYEADVSSFKWADDIAFGVAVRPNQRLLLSAKVQWINWDAAMNTVVVNLRDGNNPAKPTDTIFLPYNWDSQWVVAVGGTYDVTDQLNVRAGYNYGNDPVPASTLDPTNLNITEHHITVGAAYRFTPRFMLDGAFNYTVEHERNFSSTLWGPSTVEAGGLDFTVSLTYWN